MAFPMPTSATPAGPASDEGTDAPRITGVATRGPRLARTEGVAQPQKPPRGSAAGEADPPPDPPPPKRPALKRVK